MVNTLIVNLSQLKKDTTEYVYTSSYDASILIYGVQTNEAAAKDLILHLSLQNEKLDQIVMFETPEIEEKKGDSVLDAVKTFESSIERFCGEKDIATKPKFYEITWNEQEGTVALQKLLANYKDFTNQTFYIDTTGGKRAQADWLIFVTNYLSYCGAKINRFFYSDIVDTKVHKGQIREVNLQTLLKLTQGAEQFVSDGKCKILLDALSESDTYHQSASIKKLLEEMKNFSEAFALCRINDLSSENGIFDKLADALNTVVNEKYTDEREILLQALAETIKTKTKLGESNTIIDKIEWCVENDLIQQALTLYESQMPKHFVNELFFDDEEVQRIREANNAQYESSSQHKMSSDFENWLVNCKFFELLNSSSNTDNNDLAQEFLNALNDLQNSDDYQIDLTKLSPNCQELISKILRIAKNWSFLKDKGQIIKDSDQKVSSQTIVRFYNKTKYTSATKFINALRSQARSIVRDAFPNERIISNGKFWQLRYGDFSQTRLNFCISVESTRKILTDYQLIKTIRNSINHASEIECGEFRECFCQTYLIDDVNDMSMSEIKKQIIDSLNYIKQVKIGV